jgi:hypothetical protein
VACTRHTTAFAAQTRRLAAARSTALSTFLLRLREKSSRAKAQRLRLIAETTIKAQLINWFQAVKIKIRPKAFVLPPTTPKKSRNMSLFFWVGIFFLRLSEEVSGAPFTSTV